jgi:signal transduction histidine kinase
VTTQPLLLLLRLRRPLTALTGRVQRVQVVDRGAGMGRAPAARAFDYFWSTAERPEEMEREANYAASTLQNAPLTGLGIGLPVSRLYASLFGGDLQVRPHLAPRTSVCLSRSLSHTHTHTPTHTRARALSLYLCVSPPSLSLSLPLSLSLSPSLSVCLWVCSCRAWTAVARAFCSR